MQLLVLLGLFALVLSSFLTRQFSRPSSLFHVLDVPNERSLHTHPTPRTGGIAIVFSVLATSAIYAWRDFAAWPAATLGLAVVVIASTSYADDRHGLSIRIRFFIHSAVATFFVATVFAPMPLSSWASPFAVMELALAAVFLVWMINLYNFMDGMDGFAGGMGVFGFGAFAALGWGQAHEAFFVLNLLTAAASLGFLVFNFPPARIFLGDAGSTVLGFLAGAYTLWGTTAGVLTLPVAILVFSPFIIDATVTLLRRLLRGENVFKAHRSHYYQRLVRLGFSHSQTVLGEYGLMAGCAITAVWMNSRGPHTQWFASAIWGLIYVIAMIAVARAEQTRIPDEPLVK